MQAWLYTKLLVVSQKTFAFGKAMEGNFCNSLASDSAIIVSFMSYAIDVIAVPLKVGNCKNYFNHETTKDID